MTTAAPITDGFGFWGPVDALHTFCEPKYGTHPQAAEFYNAFSSLLYCVFALHGLERSQGMLWQMRCGWWALLTVGLGSFAFHLTMRYDAELLDELPMLVLMASGNMPYDGAHPFTTAPKHRRMFVWGIWGNVVVLTAVYLYTRIFAFFIIGFTGCVFLAIFLACTTQTVDSTVAFCRKRAVAAICLAKLLWEIEVRTCSHAPAVWPLHILWHLLSAMAAYYMLMHVTYYRLERCGFAGVYGRRARGAGAESMSLLKPWFLDADLFRKLRERAVAKGSESPVAHNSTARPVTRSQSGGCTQSGKDL